MMLMLQLTGMRMGVPAEKVMMCMALAGDLAIQIEQPEAEKHSAREAGKPDANTIGQGDSEPCDKEAKDRGKNDVAAPGESGDPKSLTLTPVLRAGRENERQPVSRNGG